jgi:hypothetical protein
MKREARDVLGITEVIRKKTPVLTCHDEKEG